MIFSATAYAVIAITLSWVAFIPYVATVMRGETHPHVFSWLIWTLLPAIACAAQISAGGGIGSYVTGCAALQSLCITGLALMKGEKTITRGDIASFAAALMAIPVWYLTQSALVAVVMVTAIDLLGFYPTIRKSWDKPREEYLPTYLIVALSFSISVMALDMFSITTVLYPVTLASANALFVLAVAYRRKVTCTSRRPG